MGCTASTASAGDTPPTCTLLSEEDRTSTHVLTGAGAATADGGHDCANGDAFRSSVLPPELYAEIAPFHSVSGDSTVMNMCIAAGLGQSAALRQCFLECNFDYLSDNLSIQDRSRGVANMRVWMTANPGWRRFVKPDLIGKFQGNDIIGEGEAATAPEVLFEVSLFNNPAYAIALGALEMLQYQVEVMNIDVNSCWFISDGCPRHPLLAIAMDMDDYPSFGYLLSLNSIDINALFAPVDGYRHNILGAAILELENPNQEAYIQALVEHPSLDINAVCSEHDDVAVFPLLYALAVLYSKKYKSDEFHRLVSIINILVDAGADPRLANDTFSSPIQFARLQAENRPSSRSFRKKYRAVLRVLES
mmetsp:Transcript_15151/g.32989  ORF Transcript_15151/g.32989 Transcript_15151/m.32989 type:complete len:362 (+) Transcript_15151:215-1300(+)|eukprot:CAMPEP_0178477808 /NCGR_PEP_ID=MMETSP0696-20121128/4324_1 /TAXON_ID=265572 /ORGANISM="Extubocellulus spinifer, Strain CCMP396" /LENGTH=361 /DNA_ID=CAMNT_0020105135 /DNA_START=164 /DNA_END=1249 /DNA_ORIENTATION=-